MAIFPSTNLTRTFIGSFFGIAPPYYLSVLCKLSGINMFSWYKPKYRDILAIPDRTREESPGLVYDVINKVIFYKKPDKLYDIGDFRGYDHTAVPPSVDINRETVFYPSNGNFFDVGGTPYWGDTRYDWGRICGGFTFSNMQIKIEVYDKNKTLRQTGFFRISSMTTGHWVISVSKIGIGGKDGSLYVKGYFCDYDGNVLCPIPTTTDGFIKKLIEYKQMIFYNLGRITTEMPQSQISSSALDDGSGGETSAGYLNFYNASGNDYNTGKYYPKMSITIINSSGMAVTTATKYGSPLDAPGPYMTRTFKWPHIESPSGTAAGTYSVNVVASLEYRPLG